MLANFTRLPCTDKEEDEEEEGEEVVEEEEEEEEEGEGSTAYANICVHACIK